MENLNNTTAQAAAVAQNTPKAFKNSFAVRFAKAAASKRHRERTKLEAAGEVVPAELLKREGYQSGTRSIDESILTDAERTKLATLRESKKGSTVRFKQRKAALASGLTEDQLPAELQKRNVKQTADSAAAGVVAPRRVKVDLAASVTFEDLKPERKLRRGGEDVFVALKNRGVAGYVLEKYTKDAAGAVQIIATAKIKRNELPATQGAFIKLVDKTKPAAQA